MIFGETALPGVRTIDLERRGDARGWFARAFCADELRANGLDPSLVQINLSYNEKRGTLRGMHFQRAPHEETKIVRCVRGAVLDVVVDLRPPSPSHRKWIAVELSEDNRRALYVPRGIAHGFLTLTDGAELLYLMGTAYAPDAAAGVRWNDPAFSIEWPFAPSVVAERDMTFPDYTA